ncbi:hypothetical protein AB0G79_13665 [Streptomyces sp. NPDC020807]|uniref:hypothetical protein n=1 Tax=Streptomyces sp. NPDC020807 TaxID=3155119 RepID=UPI0033D52B61
MPAPPFLDPNRAAFLDIGGPAGRVAFHATRWGQRDTVTAHGGGAGSGTGRPWASALYALVADRLRPRETPTRRPEEYRRYDAREESRLTGSDRDAWRVQRDVLGAAVRIRLDRHWSKAERRRAEAHRDDPRIRLALDSGERFNIAEVVVAGTELLSTWQNAWAPGANPRGASDLPPAPRHLWDALLGLIDPADDVRHTRESGHRHLALALARSLLEGARR